jgi:hypothetical protein
MLKDSKFADSETSTSHRRWDRWFRALDCSFQGEYIACKGQVIWYAPTSAKALTGEFASITDETDALRFVTEYGPLNPPEGKSLISLGLGHPASFECCESVKYILGEAQKFARIRKAAALLIDKSAEARKGLASALKDLWHFRPSFDPFLNKAPEEALSDAQTIQKIEQLSLQMLNMQLPRSGESAHITVQGKFESILMFESLLAVIYRKLFEELKRGKLRVCQECRTVFEWTDPRQMYCGKRCGLNLAQRRYRNRQKTRRRKRP